MKASLMRDSAAGHFVHPELRGRKEEAAGRRLPLRGHGFRLLGSSHEAYACGPRCVQEPK